MRAAKSLRLAASKWAVTAFVALSAAVSVRADRLPLPAAEQREVNLAIDEGVRYLKGAQRSSGSWAGDGAGNPVGYAALPGLTLLECGVAADDPVVRKAAGYVRRAAFDPDHPMERTYDLALTILLLDKLGDTKDEPLIHTLALRLVAGQTSTGGWGYKCPLLTGAQGKELSSLLHRIAPGSDTIPMKGEALVGIPAAGGNPPGQPALNPGGPGNGAAANGAALAGRPALNPSAPGDATKLPGGAFASPGDVVNAPPAATKADSGMLTLRGGEEFISERHWAWCIKAGEDDTPDAAPPAPPPAKPKPPPPPAGPLEPLRIPADMQQFTVLKDFSKLQMVEPQDNKTDNSNTQFAILALWVAQRHDVPMERTLRLVANRFRTSQNADGSWGYQYAFGGGAGEGPAMDCVGLLGLAVAQGISQGGNGAPDPAILNGFAALSKHVGAPAGQTRDLPLANLYMLWSIERVSVLYGLPTIADKDWYRWGAEILVANQSLSGEWSDGGGYPGQTPLASTCFALLFLRKANLVADLGAALPFKPEQLNASIVDRIAPKETQPAAEVAKTKPPADPPTPADLQTKPVQPTVPAEDAASKNLSMSPSSAAPVQTEPAKEGGGEWWLILVLALVAVLLLAASGTMFFVHLRMRNKSAKVSKKGRIKKAVRREGASAAAGPVAKKKAAGKSRLGS
ncbi:MAG TPA: prenyltransferase/squalene oxidase repeat-containing protein [Gemmataceae bacterium]|nr:prenyltransferase/squalene oxidase repeat-containing protein [Gemmataceae bacterium]